jgi:hypothetical protein
MARTTHVKKAQQRYETVVVLDDEGNPKRTPVMKSVKDYDTGEVKQVQKTTKKGKPVFMTVTVADKSKPKPPETCTACHQPIEIGTPYKHITPKSGPYGGRRMARHEGCPGWQVWDYSSSLSAQLARISYDFNGAIDSAEGPDDVQSALDDAGASIEEIAGQKREGAENIENGYGHPTGQSEELEQMADDLEQWASDVTSATIPEMVDCEECTDGQKECETCGGAGEQEVEQGEGMTQCEDCSGTGELECDNCDGTGEDVEAFREAVRDEVTIIDESPV